MRILKEAGERDLYKLACGLYQTHQTTYCIYARDAREIRLVDEAKRPGVVG